MRKKRTFRDGLPNGSSRSNPPFAYWLGRPPYSSIALNIQLAALSGFCGMSNGAGGRAMSETRKIAAILVTDIVGYSRLAGADEDRILARLRALRSDLMDPTITLHHGRVVKRTGDGSLVEFRSVVDAVRCTIEVQNGLVERNAGLPPERRIEFRVGIHLGDVVQEADSDLMGDGVNIAARLESICEPGGVCLSAAAYEQVRDKLKYQFVDLGEKQLKNIARPVHAYALSATALALSTDQSPTARVPASKQGARRWTPLIAACGIAALLAAGWLGSRAWSPAREPAATVAAVTDKLTTAPRLSIVVLPFENLSGDKEQDYFADGITDDLTTDLSHLPDSFVVARNTAFTYRGKPVDVKQVGGELGVRYVLEGSVRRVDENITVNAQLISTETGAHIWADRFDGERSQLGELQVEFVSRLANSLGVELVRAEALRAMRERPNNPDAVDLSMRGWTELYRPVSKASHDAAADLFGHALALDPQLVPAMVGLAQVLEIGLTNQYSVNPKGDIARAEDFAERAVAAEPDNSAAHLAKADVFFAKRQWRQAIAEAETAIADNPNNAGAHARDGFYRMLLGRSEEGFSGVETAFRLSPRDPSVPYWQYMVCHLHSHLAQWQQAIDWCNKAHAGSPGNWYPLVDLAAANAWVGRDKDAKEAVAELQKVYPGFTVQKWAGIHWTDDPTFNAQYARIVEGLRKAGLPEGDKPADAAAAKTSN
jgi:adenylate cyclase